jgi:TolB-like protein
MGAESPNQVGAQGGAVFLSYASEDAAAAERIATALRSAGIEVWFDKSELRGGDAWDRRIRQHIHDCRLFIPVISANSERRDEGYFRREWSLAADRTRDMAHKRAFLVPVVIDETPERGASVPEKFHELQWTRLPAGETPPAFVERVRRLLSPEASPARVATTPSGSANVPISPISVRQPWRSKAGLWATGAVLAVALAYIAVDKLLVSRHLTALAPAAIPATQPAAATPAGAAAFNPPLHSIAVLPFVNMSGDKEQEYFSDGLSEELLNDLSRINELRVAARTSAFSFKGRDADIGTIARRLNVAAVLEGSVRRSAHTVRITAQLVNATSGFHMWSQTYDRDLGDLLRLQTEIAEAVVNALKVTLLGDLSAKIELGGTRNPAAFDAYLRAMKGFSTFNSSKDQEAAIAAFTEAIRLDSNYPLALAMRALALGMYAAGGFAKGQAIRDSFEKAQTDALRAISLAPDLADGHYALAWYLEAGTFQFARAAEEYQRAVTLAPGNAIASLGYGHFAVLMGHTEAGVTAARRAVVLNPLDAWTRSVYSQTLFYAHRYGEAIASYQDDLVLNPDDPDAYSMSGVAHYALGNLQEARSSCEVKPSDSNTCLAVTYARLGRHADAEAVLEKFKATNGNDAAYEYAEIFAQWGNTAKALEWLQVALRMREPVLVSLKVDPLLDPLRNEPRFQAIERGLNFPH